MCGCAADSGVDGWLWASIDRRLRRLLPLPPALLSHQVARVYADEAHIKSSGPRPEALLPHLSLAQLLALREAVPRHATSMPIVEAVLAALAPADGVDVHRAGPDREAYLASIEAFVAPLPVSYNTVRLALLYNRLTDALATTGDFSGKDALVNAYIGLPRSTGRSNRM